MFFLHFLLILSFHDYELTEDLFVNMCYHNGNNIFKCSLFIIFIYSRIRKYWPIAVDYISKCVSPAVDTVCEKIEIIWR